MNPNETLTRAAETQSVQSAKDYMASVLHDAAIAVAAQWEAIKAEDISKAVYCGMAHQSAFAVVALLETLRQIDPAAADRMAVWVNECQEDGDAAGWRWQQWRGQLADGEQLTDVGPGDEPADLTTDQKVPDAACGAVREETGIRCGEPAGHTGHHKGAGTDEHGEPVFSRWSNTEADRV